MRAGNLIVLLLSLCWLLALGSDDVDDHDVVVLTDKTLESYVSDKELMLVEFYAPWCGHCKHLAPEYAEAATVLKKDGVELAKVDATAETASASKYGVSGYPTLKIFRNGVASDYNGPRTASGIINYMKKQVGPASKELNTVEEAEKMFSLDEVIITGFFVSKSGSDHRTFIALANALRDKFKFAYTNSEALLSHYGYRNAVVMFKPYDEKRLVYHGSMTQSAITEWIYGSNLPLAGVLTKANSELYQRKGKAILKLLVDVDLKTNKKQADYYLNRLRKVAKDYSDISFTVADRKEFTEDKDRYGFSGLEPVQMVIDDLDANEKFKYEGDKFSVDSIKEFAEGYASRTLKAYIKSEPVPTTPHQPGEVAVVVGETFGDIVLDETKDVMIEFYAPWCGHCKSLAPKYEQLASELKDVSSVVVAKMDATANDSPHPAYKASGFPTIFFAPANKKDIPVKYEGEREVAALKKFIREKGSLPETKKIPKK